jgi:3-hydroxyisobutyrate dehydrogenase-like beta-hydroxyacid dehydrogenase
MIATSPQFAAVTGVGVMGGAIAARFLKEGHRIVTFDPDAAKIAALVEKKELSRRPRQERRRAPTMSF